jgi:nucleotide-binding universal stress UspA family protein
MFTHLLVPTDGSAFSEAAARQALRLAKEQEARVTVVHVIPEFHVLSYRTTQLEDTRDEYLAHCKAQAQQYLGHIEAAAREQGVPCDTVVATSDHPYEAITATAEREHCDLIVMASHGRRGLKSLLLGSETQKVLTHSKTPVLVLH